MHTSLCGIDLTLQSVPPSSIVFCPKLSLTSKHVFSLLAKRTGSACKKLTMRETLHIWTYIIQYRVVQHRTNYIYSDLYACTNFSTFSTPLLLVTLLSIM